MAAHDTRDKNKRKTKTSKMAVDEPTPEEEVLATIADDVELRPEHQVLQKDLAINRKELLQGSNGRAVKSVMVDLNGVAARILNDKDPEKILVRDAATSLRQLIVSQGTFLSISGLQLLTDLIREICGKDGSGSLPFPKSFQ